MGAAVSAAQEPLSLVEARQELGVLFDEGAAVAFASKAEGGSVGWPAAKTYAERAGLLERGRVFFANLSQFREARAGLEGLYNAHFVGDIKREIPWRTPKAPDALRQRGLAGGPAADLDDLYAVANLARPLYAAAVTEALESAGLTSLSSSAAAAASTNNEGSSAWKLAPLKGRSRAADKARNEYAARGPPAVSWLVDIVRGSVVCETERQMIDLYKGLDGDPRVDIVRTKNRFNPPEFNGYRDLLLNLAVKVPVKRDDDEKGGKIVVTHLCELQVHHRAIKESEHLLKSHVTYEYFRALFVGNSAAVAERLNLLIEVPVEAATVPELVEQVQRRGDEEELRRAAELLRAIAEPAAAVAVLERLAELERASKSPHFASTLESLGNACGDAGDVQRQRSTLEEVLTLLEDKHGEKSPELTAVLNALANAAGDCGDLEAKRGMLERAHAIAEAAHGPAHHITATAVANLGNYYGQVGDAQKWADHLGRALVIFEAAFPEGPVVATTLMNLGNAVGDLGDHARKKELLERALGLTERLWGREHHNTAKCLAGLARALGALGDHAGMRDALDRALEVKEREFGPMHRELVLTLLCLASAHGALGDVPRQGAFAERALRIQEATDGPVDRASLCGPLSTLADARGSAADHTGRRKLLLRRLAIEERDFSPKHVALTLENLAASCAAESDFAGQRGYLERALGIRENITLAAPPDEDNDDATAPQRDVDVAITLTNLANCRGDLGDQGAKRDLLLRALVTMEARCGPESHMTAIVLTNLANAHGALGDPTTKRDLLHRALPALRRAYGPDHAIPQIAERNLAEALSALAVDPSSSE